MTWRIHPAAQQELFRVPKNFAAQKFILTTESLTHFPAIPSTLQILPA
jgi:hypothetical protein